MDLPSTAQGTDGRTFVRRVLLYTGGYVLFAIAVIAFYLFGLLRLSWAQWLGFAEIVALALFVIFPAMVFTHRGIFERIRLCLDQRAEGTATPEDLRLGFAAIANFPRYWFVWGMAWWVAGGAIVGLGMWLRYDDFSLVHAAIVLAATVSAAFVTDAYYYLSIKRLLEPMRVALAAEIGEPPERRALTRPVSLRTKLLAATTSVIVVTTVFAAFLAHTRSEQSVRTHVLRSQQRFLDGLVTAGAEGGLAEASALASRYGVTERVLLLDPEAKRVERGAVEGFGPDELAHIRALGPERGTSGSFVSGSVFAWRRLPGDGRIAVAATPAAALGPSGGLGGTFGLLVAIATALAVGVAYLLARDVGRATEVLRRQAARVASGDLTPGEIVESEDELGDLAHGLEGMVASLRWTVGELAEAAERMQSASGEIAGASRDVATVSADQVAGIEQATRSMTSLDGQVREIAGSAERLRAAMEGASSSIVQLDATGGELAESATVLTTNAGEVASSVDQMAASITQVARNADVLSGAADDASSSMDQTAASVRDVDVNASEMDRLSSRVVELAESGHDRVQQTIQGMDAIQGATESVERGIQQLAQSIESIGAVVEVIDDVADETNLLALNAAIIAAQSGEHGRAFAVVAEQIKDLADRVFASTKAIGQLIDTVQSEGAHAERAITRGTASVRQGVDLSGEAGVALEAITAAARESGERVAEIAAAVSQQNRAVSRVAELIASVRSGSGEIRQAIFEQGRNTGALRQNSGHLSGIARQVHSTTEEQARSAHQMRETVQHIRVAVEEINGALQEQAASCRQAGELLGHLAERTRSNEQSNRRLDHATGHLSEQAEALRAQVRRFRI